MSTDYDIDDRTVDVARALIDVYERRSLTSIHEHYTAYRTAVELLEEYDIDEQQYAVLHQKRDASPPEAWELSVGKHVFNCRNCQAGYWEQFDGGKSYRCLNCSKQVSSNPLVKARRIADV